MNTRQWKRAAAYCLTVLALTASSTTLCNHNRPNRLSAGKYESLPFDEGNRLPLGEEDHLALGKEKGLPFDQGNRLPSGKTDELSESVLRLGDLLFVEAQQQTSCTMDEAISSSTGNHTHVAIVLSTNSIIDATPRHGVAIRSMAKFLQECSGNSLDVLRVRKDICLDTAYLRRTATALNGQDYDYYFMPNNDKYYCSELVETCYRTCDGTPLFYPAPMNFFDRNGSLPPYWQHLYDSLQCPVPQGVPGTNPTALSKSSCLIPVHPPIK